MGKKTIKRESLQMAEAFEYYYSLGEERNLEKVAVHFGCTDTTVGNWSASFNWQERIQQRDILVAGEMQKKTIKEIAKSKANYRKIVGLAIQKFAKKLVEEDGAGIDLSHISDLEKLVKLDLLLMGEVVDKREITGTTTVNLLTEEDRRAAMELAEAMKAHITQAVSEDEAEEVNEEEMGENDT